MATINDYYSPYVVVPKLPKYNPYNSQQNTDPSAYYTKALGLLPIDTRYMVNTTNSLAYNSMADVLFNKAAQEARWADKPWMQGVLNPLRLVADTYLLSRDTVWDPMIQGAIEDGWRGFRRGGGTALVNTLVNLGNTLDIVSNPIKGLVLEGEEGFVKGLIGDENGRKQYDYNAYIDTGNGVANFVLSLAAEIVSDPLNWISFGSKAAVKAGADTAADAVIKSVKTSLKEALDANIKNIDDLVPELTKTVSYLSDDTARSLLKQMAGDSDTITKAMVSQLDDLQPVLKKAITVAETSGDYGSLASKFAQGKMTRFKASGVTPTTQMFVSDYLKAASTTMPDLLGSSASNAIKYGARTYKGVQNIERALRQTAGLTGITTAVYLGKQGTRAAGWIRNINALKDKSVIKTIGDLEKALDIKKVDKVIKVLDKVTDPTMSKELVTKAYDLKNTFNFVLNNSSFDKASIENIQAIQKSLIKKADEFTKGLNIEGVSTFSDYIKYLEDNVVALKNTDAYGEASEFIKELQTINKILSEDFSDDSVIKHYKKSVEALQFKKKQEAWTQQQQMNAYDKMYGEFRQKYSDIIPELEKHGTDVSDALDKLTKVNPKTNRDILDELRNNIIPYTLDALVKSKQLDGVIESFKDISDMFKSSLDEYLENPADIVARSNLVKSYQDLAERLKSYTKFDIPEEGINASNASEIYNMLGEVRLSGRKGTNTRAYKLSKEDQYILKRAETIEKELANDAEYKQLRQLYTNMLREDPYALESSRKHTMDAVLTESEIRKRVDKELESYINAKFSDINKHGYSMANAVDTLNKAREIRSLLTTSSVDVNKIKELSRAISDLPELSVKPLNSIIDPADVSKYKLVVYTVMNRMSSFANRMLGIAEDGSSINRILESIRVSPKVLDEVYNDEQIGSFLTLLKEQGLLPEAYNIAPGVNNAKLNFAVAIKYEARKYLGANSLFSDAEDWFSNYYWMDLDSFARSNSAFNEAWEEYNKLLTDFNLARIEESSEVVYLQTQLNVTARRMRNILEEQTKNTPQMGHIRAAGTDLLRTQAENILKMSDEDIIALAKFDTEEIYNYPEAYLSKLLTEYNDHTSDLYKFLNSTEFAPDSFEGTVITKTKNLVERLQAYKSLVTKISDLAKANGLEGFYTEGLLDAFMTQLTKHPIVTEFNISKIVEDMMSSTNLFVRNMYDAPATSMDRLLGQVYDELSKSATLDEAALIRLNRIYTNLKSGMAHGAVTDVDNLVDLMWLSKHTDDVRIKDMFDSFRTHAAGKRVVVFDIESTGANEAAAHVFQIAGKVLDENGEEIIGSNFNFIIKPPAGIKPTPNVLKTLAPTDVDPEKWWTDNIVNAVSNDTQTVYNTIEDALEAFTKHCSDQGSVVLMGHNIKAYDLPTLIKRATTAKAYLKKVDMFDTLRDIEHKVMYQLTDAQDDAFKEQLKVIFENALSENNPALGKKPFAYADVMTLSELKQMLRDNAPTSFTKSDIKQMASKGYGDVDIDDATGDVQGVLSGVQLKYGSSADTLEDLLDGILHEWRSPAKIKGGGDKYFIVSKLNPDSVEDQIQSYLKELADNGLINIKPGTNIMQYMSGGVSKGNIIINPVRVISYEVEDIFDLNKALKEYAVENIDPGKTVKSYKSIINKKTGKLDTVPEYFTHTNVLRIQDMAKLTRQATAIQRIRNWIPKYYIDDVVKDARALLKEAAGEQKFIRMLYDEADDITIVAAAIYAYKHMSAKGTIKQSGIYKQFDMKNVIDKITDLNEKRFADIEADFLAKQDEYYTPILHSLDDDGIPYALFEEDWQTLDEFVGTVEKEMGFDGVKEFNVGHNLYNLHSAAKYELISPLAKLAKKIEAHLDSLGDGRKAVERSLKQYHSALDSLATKEILERASRTDVLASEMYARGGYVVFETASKTDLSDFKVDTRFVVVDNVLNTNGKYIQIIAATRDTFKSATDIDLAPVMLKNLDGVDNTLLDFVTETRTHLADKVVKNLGYSHGDAFVTDTVDCIRDMLSKVGVSEDVLNKLVTSDDLIESGFFKTVRANNSVIGGKALWEYVTKDPEAFCISDPFKQALYTIKYSNAERTNLIHYCSLLLNEYSDITSDMFKKLSDEDLYKLLKKDDDMVMVYITKTGYWDKTKSGLIVKEFDLVNVASITRARQMGGVHIMPRTQAAQLMKAVNEFELPPIAKIAKGISDVYKVAYLGSLGFIIRNVIDSNYKTYASLDGQVSLGKSVSHFVQTLGIVRKHTSVGQEYSKAMGKYFKSDLEYEVFYKYCNDVKDIASAYPEKLQKRVTQQLDELSEKFDKSLVAKVKGNLIEPELFSVVDAFINHGPSAGLSKTILENIPSASKGMDDIGALDKFNKWITQDTPAKFVYGANDYIEQAARLSMFLQRLELGDTIDDANKAIIKAHFDYSDKSIGMLYTEILFPFMSFSYKNLNFWVDMMYSNPMLIGQMENIFRPILDYQGLFEPDQEAYQSYDYSFDWSRDVASFEANTPWTMINAARLYHILNGNILIKHGDTVMHDAGYGEKENELYTVFKLSPSVLDAAKMLFNPLNTYSERLLPPYETMVNIYKGMKNGEDVVGQMNMASLANMLPYLDVVMQRVGYDENGLRHNNLKTRIEDAGIHQALPSVFGTAYIPVKDNVYYYDSDYNILGGFKQNYYAKRNYSNPYNSKYPSYTLTRMAQNKKPRSIYANSKTSNMYKYQYNSMIRELRSKDLEYRLKDYQHYY